MLYKQLIVNKLEELDNKLRSLDQKYRTSSHPYERDQIYNEMKEKISDIKTLIERQQED